MYKIVKTDPKSNRYDVLDTNSGKVSNFTREEIFEKVNQGVKILGVLSDNELIKWMLM